MMRKRLKRFLASIMVAVLLLPMCIEFLQYETLTVKAADLPTVGEASVTERVFELAALLGVNGGNLDEGSGILFTANGNACGHATNNAGDCTNCKNSYIVNTAGNWFEKKFGYTIDPALLPGHYTPSGSITNTAWTCAGFANFALWYIAKADCTSDVYRKLLGTQGAAFTKSNLQKFDIRIGDVVRVPELGHSFMFLDYAGDSAIKVLDCNWVGGDVNKIAQVKIHTISLNSSYTMAITRATNYEPDSELPRVDEEEVTARVKELARLLEVNDGNLNEGRGVLFTANGNACGHATNNADGCTNCKNSYVVNTAGNWFNKKFGYTINPALLPGHCTPAGSITNTAWTCAGFVNFALWYIAKASPTSDVYRELLGVRGMAFTKSNMQYYNIRIGDVVRVPELGHSFMFLDYVGDDAIKVLDCNWVGGDVNKIAQVRIHTISLNSSYTMAITRAVNYVPNISPSVDDTTPPALSDIKVQKDSTGYTISCVATDNVEVTAVRFPTWTEYNGQDDIAPSYPDGTYKNGRWEYRVNISDHNNESGRYNTHIYAYDGSGNYSFCGVTVDIYPLNSISLSASSKNVSKGDQFTLTVSYNPSNTTDSKTVSWSSSNGSVATVDSNGKVTAVADGTATITAKVGTKTAICKVTVSTPVDGVTSFVNRMYSLVLGRTPDSGSQTWIDGLKNGAYTGASVAEGFIMSNEFLNKNISNEEFVKIMYRAFFGREADSSGLATWKGSLDEGYMKKFVFAGFANSNEFKALCDTYGIECGVINLTLAEKTPNLSEQDFNIWQFVERLYSEVMGRNPDQTGMDTWVGVLKNGTYTGAQVAEGFILSNEFLNKNMTNEEFVKIMYRAFFNRDADTDGFRTWTEALETGWTKEAVFAGFANSDEFGRICDEYGIIQGSVTAE